MAQKNLRLTSPLLCLLLHVLPCALAQQAPPAMASNTGPGPSIISIPIRVDLNGIFTAVESQVPKSPPNIETWTEIFGKPRTYFRYNLYRDPLSLRMHDNWLNVHVAAHYGMDVGVRTIGNRYAVVGSCGRSPEPSRKTALELQTQIHVTPQWGFELRNTQMEVHPLNPCNITFLEFDITPQVMAGIKENLKTAAQTVEQLVKESALLRQRAQEVWQHLQQPMEIQKDLYLFMQPERIRLTPLRTQGRTLLLTIEIEVRPLLTLGQTLTLQSRPLPDLELTAAPASGFYMRVESDLSYDYATLQLTELLGDKRFQTDHGTVIVNTVAIYGKDGQVFLELDLDGRLKGIVTLQGRPFLGTDGKLRFDELDFTLESRSWITKTAAWLFKSTLRKTIQEKATLLLDRSFQDVRIQLQGALNRQITPHLNLSGSLKELRVERVLVMDQGLKALAYLEGNLQIEIK